MTITDHEELLGMQKIGQIVADCLQMMLGKVEPGITTSELDELGKKFLEEHGAVSAPQKMYKFPGATCISLNEESAHGVPSKSKKVQKGDLINIDVSAELNGFFGDTGASMLFQGKDTKLKQLCKTTRQALNAAIKQVKPGAKLSSIGKAIEKEANKNKLSIVRNLCSHGIGRSLHEYPEEILSYFSPQEKRIIEEGMAFTIEPFISTGAETAKEGLDGWTLMLPSGHFSAQYEHTMVATKHGAKLMTLPTNGQPFQPL